jgi:hypothetical protein
MRRQIGALGKVVDTSAINKFHKLQKFESQLWTQPERKLYLDRNVYNSTPEKTDLETGGWVTARPDSHEVLGCRGGRRSFGVGWTEAKWGPAVSNRCLVSPQIIISLKRWIEGIKPRAQRTEMVIVSRSKFRARIFGFDEV